MVSDYTALWPRIETVGHCFQRVERQFTCPAFVNRRRLMNEANLSAAFCFKRSRQAQLKVTILSRLKSNLRAFARTKLGSRKGAKRNRNAQRSRLNKLLVF